MAGNGSVRNRSQPCTIATPRGHVEVAQQETRGLQRNLGWRWFWVARRRGQMDWHEATTAKEAIRKAMLLPPRKPPTLLQAAATDAERLLLGEQRPDDAVPGAAD